MIKEEINVLYISYDGMTDPLGQSQVLPYIIGLTKAGYKFTLLSFEKQERFSKYRGIIEKICIENNIDWHPLNYTKSPPVLSTVWDIIRLKRLVLKLHKKINFSIIHCRSYLPALIGLDMKNKFGTKFIFDMRGFWADERVDGNLWKLNNPIYKSIYSYFKKKEKHFLEKADSIVSLTHKAKNEMESWEEIKRKKLPITVIPCCVDTNHFNIDNVKERDKEKYRKELCLNKNDFILSYLGSVGTWYMLDEMLLFFKYLLTKQSNAKFFFISGEPKEYIYKKANRLNVPINRIIVRFAQRKEVPILLSLCNFSIFFIKPAYSKMSSSPTKQGEIMSMGIPVVCNRGVGDTDMIVEKYQSGLLLNDFSEKEIMANVTNLNIKDFAVSRNIRNGAIEYFSLEKGIEQYFTIYKQVAS